MDVFGQAFVQLERMRDNEMRVMGDTDARDRTDNVCYKLTAQRRSRPNQGRQRLLSLCGPFLAFTFFAAEAHGRRTETPLEVDDLCSK
jgi:hypothetical protein